MTCLDSLTNITLEWWDTHRFWLGFSLGWLMCCMTFMLTVTLIKSGVGTL